MPRTTWTDATLLTINREIEDRRTGRTVLLPHPAEVGHYAMLDDRRHYVGVSAGQRRRGSQRLRIRQRGHEGHFPAPDVLRRADDRSHCAERCSAIDAHEDASARLLWKDQLCTGNFL